MPCTSIVSSPFFCLPPSGVPVSRENIEKADTQKWKTSTNRTEQNKTKHEALTLDFYKSVTQEQQVNLRIPIKHYVPKTKLITTKVGSLFPWVPLDFWSLPFKEESASLGWI